MSDQMKQATDILDQFVDQIEKFVENTSAPVLTMMKSLMPFDIRPVIGAYRMVRPLLNDTVPEGPQIYHGRLPSACPQNDGGYLYCGASWAHGPVPGLAICADGHRWMSFAVDTWTLVRDDLKPEEEPEPSNPLNDFTNLWGNLVNQYGMFFDSFRGPKDPLIPDMTPNKDIFGDSFTLLDKGIEDLLREKAGIRHPFKPQYTRSETIANLIDQIESTEWVKLLDPDTQRRLIAWVIEQKTSL